MTAITNEKGDEFDKWFRKFSKEHSWHKIGGEHNFYFVPQIPGTSYYHTEIEYPWTLHCSSMPSDLPSEAHTIIESCPVSINGLVWGGSLHIVLESGGLEFLASLEKLYPKSVAALRKDCTIQPSNYKPTKTVVHYDGQHNTKRGCVGKMMRREYQRMSQLARQKYFEMIGKLYTWFRKQSTSEEPVAMGSLHYVKTQYLEHCNHILVVAQEWIHIDIVKICQEYHHVF